MPDTNFINELWRQALDWLMAPMSGAADHDLRTGVYLHGRLMVLAWGMLVPMAILISRFYKVTPGQDWPRVHDNPFWFLTHRSITWAVGVLMIAGVALIMLDDPWQAPWRSLHSALGWIVVLACLAQLFPRLYVARTAARSTRPPACRAGAGNGPTWNAIRWIRHNRVFNGRAITTT